MNNNSAFERALFAERQGRYAVALKLFEECLAQEEYDDGDVLFHCGWCTEQQDSDNGDRALRYYELAAAQTRMPECKLNSFFRAGWLLMHQKEFVKAGIRFRNAIDYGELSYHKNETYIQSAYWYAVCLESQGWYIEAMKWYRFVRLLSPPLEPESRIREIACLNHVGSYDEALSLCRTFDASPPDGFEEKRYRELQVVALRERDMLQQCMLEGSSSYHGMTSNGNR